MAKTQEQSVEELEQEQERLAEESKKINDQLEEKRKQEAEVDSQPRVTELLKQQLDVLKKILAKRP